MVDLETLLLQIWDQSQRWLPVIVHTLVYKSL